MRFLLDTNVFCEIGSTAPNANVAAWLATVDDADLAVSALTVREVRKGIEKLRVKKPDVAAEIDRQVRETLDAFGDRVLPVTREIADLWGELLAQREKHIDDTGLVATARVHGLVLATRNLKDISGRGATALDPFKTAPKIVRP
ncbi:type II toxin-antitoxin system VapC family toxin [Bradyrhizobium guangzhouense]|uniref:type II toxin-antitoxin system VapC family toxin n=1 Tax=Bradyrhizobium guangzhouense TaxID=1325095 RepID=UPI001009F0A5|nr:type II toxin-antitoxin system VapC family toxin [Bradyrhizobium guangzhouense]RXH15603.1 type II toxin-antitoxin system VapC family toxin [Bradyrhizobium guangzhouense]